ncbi:MAG: PBP1A family penicillin-binding protein [Clostridia bacterium]|nr:PBP1A family penicillin-binding protein [Clostridia bacterium]
MKRILLFIICACVILIVSAIVLMDIPSWKKLDIQKITGGRSALIILSKDESEISAYTGNAAPIRLTEKEIPEMVKNAFVACEDERFYTHAGVDIRRIFSAFINNVKAMRMKEGASTITQQLIKLTHLTPDKTISRKANEAFLALQLERVLTKDEILVSYMNTVYFGSGAYGVESAARTYFGKSTNALTLSEAALLAGIIKAPSAYSPDKSPDKALERRGYVLKKMLELGYITEDAYNRADNEPLMLHKNPNKNEYGWYRDLVIDEACRALHITSDELYVSGYTIYTGMDPVYQKKAEDLFAESQNFPSDAEDGEKVQSALSVLDSETGRIMAAVGGREYEVERGFHRAYQMKRQPGSVFKPISVYAAAIDRYHLSPSSIIDDTKRTFDGGYEPRNASDHYYGLVTLREALSKSLNVASVNLIEFTSVKSAGEYAINMGIELSESDNGLSLALGSLTNGVTPLELTGAYAALSNGGLSIEPHAIYMIKDREGNVVYRYVPKYKQVMSEDSAYLITSMLRTAAAEGSAKELSKSGVPIAGKTGTVSMQEGGNRDIWAAAYTPEITACVWMGFDNPDNQHMLPASYGGSGYPCRLLSKLFEGSGIVEFEKPESIETVKLDKAALLENHLPLIAPDYAPDEYVLNEVFKKEYIPKNTSLRFEAPEPVKDLQAEVVNGKEVHLSFTVSDENYEYLIFRETENGKEVLHRCSGQKGEILKFTDLPGRDAAYSIVVRNTLLNDTGVYNLSQESDRIEVVIKKSLIEQIEDLFSEEDIKSVSKDR